MNTAVINFKTEPKIKKEAQKVAKEMGIPLSAVINQYLRYFVATRSIAFQDEGEEPSEDLKKIIRKAEKNLKAGKSSPAFENAEDAIDYLHQKSA